MWDLIGQIWDIYRTYSGHLWDIFGTFMGHVRDKCGTFLEIPILLSLSKTQLPHTP